MPEIWVACISVCQLQASLCTVKRCNPHLLLSLTLKRQKVRVEAHRLSGKRRSCVAATLSSGQLLLPETAFPATDCVIPFCRAGQHTRSCARANLVDRCRHACARRR